MADPTSKPEQRHCRYPKCGKAIKFVKKRSAWVHVTPGANHPPVP
jgi:hypothetical protein